ncbi:haloacid dehalogenase superfamily, subfamily IA, variant 3 with third motif having DD or ED/haloacid dehalogenase superfamily, subfamily IA, variant 1 with third motif having Dx(3-4)D or Dx(3-4)E [Lentzea waywayandensis]|uniref:Haloacid dehalogenase superfamily, subfamily IA, variant 3 with third motif having DD or ED/haloacid dehalogenase superfamily, subfamily IA, variant 1 with third motif having Dx(3-4)D or Dx(3-4)E n=1 Tax=Lentzea waywayandensis TaxID=84724 RepID=A0A1I6EJ68_9PSEU|nr:HAD family phosphatase [Lentzea waywayandensis]SFR17601.1 haloacid dehalogenase superfamily, subfamily IA, variant 3 with third motif having DD or ED/haloacid dehalogenase superfamily, subfamily IA, variant 1 with third motif having Dx(3-4)D or Dx(3-4)E [Lentzea waywayandensis]
MDAVIFDLDGVLIDSEQVWDEVRQAFAAAHGGTWTPTATRDMQGMSTPEWGAYLVSAVGVRMSASEASAGVIAEMEKAYAAHLPVLPGAVDAVRAVAARFPVAIASSAPAVLIKVFLDVTGLPVPVAVSSESCAAGKPSPDVYLAAAAQLGVPAASCYAVEDSTNGLKAALAAGMTVLAVPNPHFPPAADVLAQVRVLSSIADLPDALA